MKKLSLGILSTLVFVQCTAKKSENTQPTVVQEVRYVSVTQEPNVRSHVSGGHQKVEVTLNKALLNQEFLYGADIQYSGKQDAGMGLYLQSMAVGHFIARFQVAGDRLHLMAEAKHLFESNINHPETMLQNFQIVSQNENQITILISEASPILEIAFFEKRSVGTKSYLRSFEFVEKDNLLLMETTLEDAKGEPVHVMESIFPRKNLVQEADPVLLADAELEPLANRFRFLTFMPAFIQVDKETRVKTQAATRFPLRGQSTIDWYVTNNIPDQFLPAVQQGVEGWNRYFIPMKGREVVKFKGKLPENIRIGDPRFNVINWDSVEEAGAAYESQASDPLTGIQSHSLIYLPYAWYNLGKTQADSGSLTDAAKKLQRKNE